MSLLILLRHGESLWNAERRFAGRADVGLSGKGETDAESAGQKIKNLKIDKVYTSCLKRAVRTWEIAARTSAKEGVPVKKEAALNERNFGDLQGLTFDEASIRFTKKQVAHWTRNYTVRPPGGESLEDAAGRILPFFEKEIIPCLARGENILIVSHGDILRSLVKHLEKLSSQKISEMELACAAPRIYQWGRYAATHHGTTLPRKKH